MVIAVFRYNHVELGRACPKSFPEPCPKHGVVTEHVPWSDGKRPVTVTMMCFLSRRARRLSWRETARVFGTIQIETLKHFNLFAPRRKM
jgi:hypothetical protein